MRALRLTTVAMRGWRTLGLAKESFTRVLELWLQGKMEMSHCSKENSIASLWLYLVQTIILWLLWLRTNRKTFVAALSVTQTWNVPTDCVDDIKVVFSLTESSPDFYLKKNLNCDNDFSLGKLFSVLIVQQLRRLRSLVIECYICMGFISIWWD